MTKAYEIVVFPGDYGGPEVMKEGLKVLSEIQRRYELDVTFILKTHLIGGASFDAYGTPITTEALSDAKAAAAVLLGAVGGPKWDGVPVPVESGLGKLRKSLDAFGNLRPVNFVAPSLVHCSSFKVDIVSGTDTTIVRELTGGVYFGERHEHDGTFNSASDLDHYDRESIVRVARLAGKLAMSKQPPLPVISLDKANLLAACGRLWRGVVKEVFATEFPTVKLTHMLIDTAAMNMARHPKSLNGVILTSNMFGDIISDEASAIPGSMGLLPSASLCDIPVTFNSSNVKGIYEPIHGSAPDIAGKDIINPTGMILSVAMMLRHSLNMPEAAELIEDAVKKVIEKVCRTSDIGGTASTTEFGNAVVLALNEATM